MKYKTIILARSSIINRILVKHRCTRSLDENIGHSEMYKTSWCYKYDSLERATTKHRL